MKICSSDYRIIKEAVIDNVPYYTVAEVFYNELQQPEGYAECEDCFIEWNNVEGIKNISPNMQSALKKPMMILVDGELKEV